MTEAPAEAVMAGGCQCGAVRYALMAEPAAADICHCRMCQKATGNLFFPSADVTRADLVWTRGTPKTFRSSAVAERGFCADCGTSLTFGYLGRDRISVSIGSLDEPARLAPTVQVGTESRIPWWPALFDLPEQTTEDGPPPGGADAVQSRQQDR